MVLSRLAEQEGARRERDAAGLLSRHEGSSGKLYCISIMNPMYDRRNGGVRRANIVKTRADIIAGRDIVLDTAIHSLQTTH
jgi:hypothetical protein